MLRTILFVAVGGGLGSALRYLSTLLVQRYYASVFPLATFLVNILGCLLIGFVFGFLEKNNLQNSNLKWLLVTGFCGGFTTFSAFGFENITLFNTQNSIIAFLYIGLSVFIGILMVGLGLFLSKNFY